MVFNKNVNIYLRYEQKTLHFNNEMIKSIGVEKEGYGVCGAAATQLQTTKEKERQRNKERKRQRGRERGKERRGVGRGREREILRVHKISERKKQRVDRQAFRGTQCAEWG